MEAGVKVYLVSFGAGILVGVIYGLLNVRSPAPPVVALIGLLGILLGEQLVPIGKHMLAGSGPHAAWRQAGSTSHLFGMLPGHKASAETVASPVSRS